jgi:hypothetical protein
MFLYGLKVGKLIACMSCLPAHNAFRRTGVDYQGHVFDVDIAGVESECHLFGYGYAAQQSVEPHHHLV